MDKDRNAALFQTGICFKQLLAGFKNTYGWKSFISVAIIAFLIVIVLGEDTFQGFYDTKNGGFALVCACIWIGIFSSIRSICKERDIVKHEYRTGLKIVSYISAHMIFEFIICIIDALIITLIVCNATSSHFLEEGVIFPPAIELFITFFLITFSSDALGLLISSIVYTENTAMTVMPFALIIQLVMSGAIFKLEGIADTISYLTISRWGLDAICATSNVNDMPEAVLDTSLALSEFSATFSNLATLWAILFAFAIAYAILSIIILRITIDK
ncbi:MAG: ABC transporter permease [Coriobacteriales bacterium]|nr:ABC transporter permease [Coriobacteriales bacterium]